jgi:hypothetical protein
MSLICIIFYLIYLLLLHFITQLLPKRLEAVSFMKILQSFSCNLCNIWNHNLIVTVALVYRNFTPVISEQNL